MLSASILLVRLTLALMTKLMQTDNTRMSHYQTPNTGYILVQ